jgi:hypothetical protein
MYIQLNGSVSTGWKEAPPPYVQQKELTQEDPNGIFNDNLTELLEQHTAEPYDTYWDNH